MDALSTILQGLRFSGALFIEADLVSPWAIRTPTVADLAQSLGAKDSVVIPYHWLEAGTCNISAPGLPSVSLKAGDIAVFPQGHVHDLASSPHLIPTTIPREFVDHVVRRRGIKSVRLDGTGETTRILCGFFSVPAWSGAPLIGALPPLIHLSIEDGSTSALFQAMRSHLGDKETSPIGREALLSRLSEILFIDVLRRCILSSNTQLQGWLAALRDPVLKRALELLHRDLQKQWTLDELAQQCHSSRSVLAERFRSEIGLPPMRYQTKWRLSCAAQDLCAGQSPIIEIAQRYGYSSESAFSKAFRQTYDVPPATFRKRSGTKPAHN